MGPVLSPARRIGLALCLLGSVNHEAAAADGTVAAGRTKARQCAACHGLDGQAKLPEAANLAGQTASYLAIALNDYKSGARKNEMMTLVAPKLTDQDIADLAAYYASLGCGAPR